MDMKIEEKLESIAYIRKEYRYELGETYAISRIAEELIAICSEQQYRIEELERKVEAIIYKEPI